MDLIYTVSKNVLGPFLCAGGIKLLLGHTADPSRNTADFESFLGNPVPNILFAVNKMVSEGFANALRVEELGRRYSLIVQHYTTISSALNGVKLQYEVFERQPADEHWRWFENEIPPLNNAIDELSRWITDGLAGRKNLMGDLADICGKDMEEYEHWQHDIALSFACAYSLRIFYEFKVSERGTKFDELHRKMKEMEAEVRKVTGVMNKKFREFRVGFLKRKCADTVHEHCGAENSEKCCELASEVYQLLRNDRGIFNGELACQIANHLKKQYPYLCWSAVVLKDYRSVDVLLNSQFHEEIWYQRFGSRSPNRIFQKRSTKTLTMSNGNGNYGCFVCHRSEMVGQKCAIIFWADPKVVYSPSAQQLRDQLLEEWEKTKTTLDNSFENSKGYENVKIVVAWLKHKGFNHVFGIGLRVNAWEEMGLALENNSGSFNSQYPLCLRLNQANEKDYGDCVMIWPAHPEESPVASLMCDLTGEDLGMISASESNKCYVFKSQRRKNDHTLKLVAVKQIILSVNKENQQKEINCLDVEFRNLSFLREFSHPNVVQLIGCQLCLPKQNWDQCLYRIVMELCTGGTLSERVQFPVSLPEIFKLANGILSGLAYLHLHQIPHKDIQGDHLLFSGPTAGAGDLKIASVGRRLEILSRSGAQRTYMKPDNFEFQPPSKDQKIGGKTDIWSFGCVLIQMITGKKPVLNPNGRPLIPTHIPKEFIVFLEKCLDMDYDKRPYATEAQSLLTTDRDVYLNSEWISSPPKALN